MWFCWLHPLRNADKDSAAQSPELSLLGTWVEIHQNICEVDLWLIEGLISTPLVFIRRRNGGKARGFLTTGAAVLQAPVPTKWVRQSVCNRPASRWPVAYITVLSGALIHSGSLLYAIFVNLNVWESCRFSNCAWNTVSVGGKICIHWFDHKWSKSNFSSW